MKVVIIITCHLPGVNSDDFDAEPVQFSRFIELFRNRLQIQLIFPLRNLKRIRSVGQTFLKGSGTPMPFREHARTCNISTYCPACGITWSIDNCRGCNISVTALGLASRSSSFSLRSSSCYPCPRQNRFILARSGPLHLSGASTSIHSEHKSYSSIWLCHLKA
jgi:hypothetical protein